MRSVIISLGFCLAIGLTACASSSTTGSGAGTTPAEHHNAVTAEADGGAQPEATPAANTESADAGTSASAESADAGTSASASAESADAGTTASTESADASTTASTETSQRGTSNAGAGSSAAVIARGRAAHHRVCARCHEDGDEHGPHAGGNMAEARMRRQIRQGDRQMRPIPVSRLSDADLNALIAYYRSIRAVR